MTAKRVDLVIEQGKTFQKTVRWETTPLVWKPVSAIPNTGPMTVTATAHGAPDGWRCALVNVKGMVEANAKHIPPRDNELVPVVVAGVDTVIFNETSAVDFDTYTSGGYLVYWTPHDLTGYTGRMKIKDRVGGTVLATVPVTVDAAGLTIDFAIDAVTAAALSFATGVYDLEMVSPTGIVTAILTGSVKLIKEVTTP